MDGQYDLRVCLLKEIRCEPQEKVKLSLMVSLHVEFKLAIWHDKLNFECDF